MTNIEPWIAERAQISYGKESISTPGTKASTSALYIGATMAADLPDPKIEWKKIYSRGNGRVPLTQVQGKNTLEGSLDYAVQNADFLVYAFGRAGDTGTDVGGGGGSTLNGATAAGATTITIASGTGYADNDYIQVDTGANAEIRKISSGGGTTSLVLDAELRLAHASGVACNEVTSPYTHTLTYADTPLPTFTLEAALQNIDNFVRLYDGCKVDTWKLSCDEAGEVRANVGFKAMDIEAAGTTVSTVTVPTTVPWYHAQAAFTAFGGALARVTSWSVEGKNGVKPLYFQRSTKGSFPQHLVCGRLDTTVKAKITPIATTAWAYLHTVGAVFDFTATLTRGTGAGTAGNELMVITAKNCRITSAPHPIPEDGEISAEVEMQCEYVTVAVTDTTPYY